MVSMIVQEKRRKNNNYQVVLHNGTLELHKISFPQSEKNPSNFFPSKGDDSEITCVELTSEFLIYGTRRGSLIYYNLDEAGVFLANEYCHCNGGIIRLWSNVDGTLLLFEDERNYIYLHNPLIDQAILIPLHTNDEVKTALWDLGDSSLFVLSKVGQLLIYICSLVNIYSPMVSFLRTTTIPSNVLPTTLHSGVLTFQDNNIGGVETMIIPTHSWFKKIVHNSKQIRERFDQSLCLCHLQDAFEDANILKCIEVWDLLIKGALEHLELELAKRACQQSGNIKMLTSLQQVEHIEEFHLLRGHILMLLKDFDAAQAAFLMSSRPETAIEMRRDLKHWNQAMTLAKELDSPLSTMISKQYGHFLEKQGDYRQALSYYEDCLKSSPSDKLALAGIARISIHLGDIWKGKHLATQCNDSLLYRECAQILEELNLQQDAAELYELDGQLEKAISMYIVLKNFTKAQSLLKLIASPKFYVAIARALETDRKFLEAATAYEAAEEYDCAVRLYLGPLKNPHEAFSIVRKTKSLEGANIASRYCKNMGDYENAIEFLLLQKRTREASEVAQQHNKMDFYSERISDVASKEECLKLGRYYEATGNTEKATIMFERCGDFKHALELFLSWGTDTAIEQAIDMVGRKRDDELTNQILDFLTGDMNRSEKSPRYLLRLHMVLGNYAAATKVAILIAQQEQDKGNYKIAHKELLDVYKVVRNEKNYKAPFELSKQLMVLHSYTLVKILIRLGDHRSSARMLIRVARHISKFPTHVIPILISTVIECQRSGLKKTAFEYATMLMRPEYRNQIAKPYKRRIESIVRKPEKQEDDEPLSPCPFCSLEIPETQLECPSCRNYLPFCIASGRHMVLGDSTKCPSCHFPALISEFQKIIEADKECPMCHETVALEDIVATEQPVEDWNFDHRQTYKRTVAHYVIQDSRRLCLSSAHA